MKQRLFSGIQPSGNLHIGNYLGAMKNWVTLQNDYDALFCVVDLHAITVPQKPEELKKRTREIVKIMLASGVGAKSATIFVQSDVKEHTELCWLLNTVTRMSDLGKMTQFKDKSKDNQENVSVGLFDYPVLMAADILLYDTKIVPVGEDQTQHLELARTLARRFNDQFGETFAIPKPYIKEEGMRIMGLDDPTKKMSKSAPSTMNYISLSDTEEDVRKKIKKAVTDSGSEVVYSDEKPALKNLITIYSLLSDTTAKEVEEKYAGKRYGDFKDGLAEVVVNFLTPFQERMEQISDKEVEEILSNGAKKACVIAQKKNEEVKNKMGLG
ncbi:MAG: tryptophan--tRNA ligase [Candidatus Moranbacteria bacterium]|nr:tryptophan--tRNA ligase [Candidatus Moranbacteria bacterium]